MARTKGIGVSWMRLALLLAVAAGVLLASASAVGAGGYDGRQPAFFQCLGEGESPAEFVWSSHPGPMHPFERWLKRLFHRMWQYRQQLLASWRADHCVHLNEIQVLGSHNSYKIEPADSLFQLLTLFLGELSLGLQYTHLPLDEQLETQGIRQIELDVFADPEGDLYAAPAGPRLVEALELPPGPENDPEGLLEQPGLKVLHAQDVDFRSTCLTFVRCLQVVKAWSDANPRHLPIMVLVEAKDEPIPDPGFGFVVPLEFDAEALDQIDAEIRSVFPAWQVITPDDVRGGRASLEEAVLADGWPTLGESKGRLLFALDNGGTLRELYLEGSPSLEGRMLFVSSSPGEPAAAFMKMNDPLSDPGLIAERVAAGYIVRTRADSDTYEARYNLTDKRDAALASGAQYVSTDYPVPDPDFGTGYAVEIPDGAPACCNPVNAPPGCDSSKLELRRKRRR